MFILYYSGELSIDMVQTFTYVRPIIHTRKKGIIRIHLYLNKQNKISI